MCKRYGWTDRRTRVPYGCRNVFHPKIVKEKKFDKHFPVELHLGYDLRYINDLKVLIDAFRSSTDGLNENRVRAIAILYYTYATLGRLTMTVAHDTGSLLLLNNRLWRRQFAFVFIRFPKTANNVFCPFSAIHNT